MQPEFWLFSLPSCYLMVEVCWQHLETPMAQPSSPCCLPGAWLQSSVLDTSR